MASPESTGGAGIEFEHQIQSLFAVLMLCDGELEFAAGRRIGKIQFQTRRHGFHLDDARLELIAGDGNPSQALVQIKRSLDLTKACTDFTDTIQAAWLDYNAPRFDKNKDYLVIATGPLCKKDLRKISWLLGAVSSRNFELFSLEMKSGAGISKDNKEFYNLLCDIVRVQNADIEERDIYLFLKRLRVCYPDTLYGTGLLESFAFSLIRTSYGVTNAGLIFQSIKSHIGLYDAQGGELDKKALHDLLPLAMQHKESSEKSGKSSLAKALSVTIENCRKAGVGIDKLAILSLIGSWNESGTMDREEVRKMLGMSENDFGKLIQNMVEADLPLLSIEGGIARVKHRRLIWRRAATYVSSSCIKRYLDVVADQLQQLDKTLEVGAEKRYMLSEDRKGFSCTHLLREGMATGLALFAAEKEKCKQLSFSDRQSLLGNVIDKLFKGKDWRLWATLDDLLPYIAESAPEKYIEQVYRFTANGANGLKCLYAQETRGIYSHTYILGLVRSLAVVAWFPGSCASALQILGKMASMDPDGQWHPRPLDVLHQILNPVEPHTWASAQQRAGIFGCMVRQVEKETTWKIVCGLLPKEISIINDAVMPLYINRDMAQNYRDNRTVKERVLESEQYCMWAVKLSRNDPAKLCELISPARRRWTTAAFNALCAHLGKVLKKLTADGKYAVWKSMCDILSFVKLEDKHKRISDTQKARIRAYEKLEQLYKPVDIRYSAIPMFGWTELSSRKNFTEEERNATVKEMLVKYGVDEVIKFATKTNVPFRVGAALGRVGDESVDYALLPGRLTLAVDDVRNFIEGYVQERFLSLKWAWIDRLRTTTWNKEQIASLLLALPFNQDTWENVPRLLGNDSAMYWQRIRNPYPESMEDTKRAIDEFLSAGCGYAAMDLLGYNDSSRQITDISIIRKVFAAFYANKVVDQPKSMTSYCVAAAIRTLQGNSTVPISETARAEWHFFDFADWHDNRYGFSPVALESELVADPNAFCSALRIAYIPKKMAKKDAKKPDLSEVEEHRVHNVWKLLHSLKRVPGVDSNNIFDAKVFNDWVRRMFAQARKDDRLEIAKCSLARLLIHAPSDKDGLWLPKAIAQLMEKKGNECMLSCYRVAWFNSRGPHFVDKTGKEDENLASGYDKMAMDAEEAGFPKIASEMRSLAKMIRDDFARMKAEDDARDAYYAAKQEERSQQNEQLNNSD